MSASAEIRPGALVASEAADGARGVADGATRRFESVLRDLAARIDLPQPAKSRTLMEIAADLEDIYWVHRDRGLDDEGAQEAALDRFELSDAALADLVALHTTPLRRFMDGLSDRGRGRFERVALALVLAFMVGLAWSELAGRGLTEHLAATALPSLAVTLGAVAVAAHKSWRLWLLRDHDARTLRQGLPEILLAAVFALAFGVMGLWIEAYRVMSVLPAAVSPGSDAGVAAIVSGLRRAFATGSTGLLAALLCFALWWLVAGKVTRIERAETEPLMEIRPIAHA